MTERDIRLLLDRSGLPIPERLWPLPDKALEHPTVRSYANTQKRFIVNIAGRQSYKSEIAKRRLFKMAVTQPNRRFLVGMPTWTQTKKYYWESPLALKWMFPDWMIDDYSDSDLVMKLRNGTRIELFSGEAPQRIEGGSCDGVLLDECGDMDLRRIWEQTVSPMIVATHGWVMFLGVPRQSTGLYYKELWNRHKDNDDPDWGCFTWRSDEILSKTEIGLIKAQIDELTFLQEYCGQFVEYGGGLAYHQYSDDIVQPQSINPLRPMFLLFDFNVNPFVCLIAQQDQDGTSRILSEIIARHSNVYDIFPRITTRLLELNPTAKSRPLILYGDYSGTAKSVSSRGAVWDELRQQFEANGWENILKIRSNPQIDRRVATVNARLRSADGKRHLFIDPSCRFLLDDFKMVSMADLTQNKDRVGDRTHTSDALGYYLYYEFAPSNVEMFNV